MFNVAGKASWGSLMEVDAEELVGLFTVNAVGPLMVVQSLLRAGLMKRGSLIANLTSKVSRSLLKARCIGWQKYVLLACFMLACQ